VAGLPKALRAWLGLPVRQQIAYARRKLRDVLPGVSRIESADRRLLEETVLAGYAADPSLRILLFVGCDWYTRGYAELFAPARERFRTVDIDPAKARFGAAGHVVAPMQEIDRHFASGSVDAIVANGIYGWGIDDRAGLGVALAAAHAVLKPAGTLVLGWNDVAALAPFDPEPVALATGFVRSAANPLGAWRTKTATPLRHTFDAYARGEGGSGGA
jgi:SAM-dependent methyltransferase